MHTVKNWKTTLLGLLAGGLNLYASGTSLEHVLVSVAMAGLGLFAQDSAPPSLMGSK